MVIFVFETIAFVAGRVFKIIYLFFFYTQDVFASTRLSSAAAGGVDRKSLTVHYTCAVDSITTGRVCEAWRNMLLVDHV